MESGGRCPNCGSQHRVRDSSVLEIHCGDCGLVFNGPEIVSPFPEQPQDPNTGSGRGIGPLTRPTGFKRMLGTAVGGAKDAHGKSLGTGVRNHYEHLGWMMRRELARGKIGRGDNAEARAMIARVSSHLGLPTIIREEAERVFYQGAVEGLLRGRSLPASTGAALYAACRKYRQPHTLLEVSNALSIKRWEVGRAFKALNRGLETKVPTANLKTYLHRYAEELALSPSVRSTVEEMLETAAKRPEVSGLSPHGLVAALIYMASEQHGEKRTRSEMARVGSVTEMTLRTTTKVIERLIRQSPH